MTTIREESTDGLPTRLTPDNFAPTQSVMSQIRDPVNFPVLTQDLPQALYYETLP